MEPSSVLTVLLAAALPIGELRLSIPLAMYTFNMSWYVAFLISLIGNILPVLILVPTLSGITHLIRKRPNPLQPLLNWWSHRVLTAFNGIFQKYGAIALVIIVAIPLPITGAWTGSLASSIFEVKPRIAIPLISIGLVISGIIVTILTTTGSRLGILIMN
ncbi:small multi-drug export protein [SAR202 cluster bacterium AD-802-E10_MRT_200m]|nr:small multi-drug export protein [SAR202 cluster bacterium AD-802-E10_MRT_200m]